MEYWARAVEDMSELARKYNNDLFFTGLMLTIYGELAREYKRLKTGGSGA
jgi:hypothetical protein